MRIFICGLFLVLISPVWGQESAFDSLSFFERTRTSEVSASILVDGMLVKESKGIYDNNRRMLTWCGRTDDSFSCHDTIYFDLELRDTVYKNGVKKQFAFDSRGRLLTQTHSLFNTMAQKHIITTTHYYYADSLSRRLKFIYEEQLPSYIKTIYFVYKNNVLTEKTESFFSLGSDYYRIRKSLLYYYQDGKLKEEIITSPKEKETIVKYKYVSY